MEVQDEMSAQVSAQVDRLVSAAAMLEEAAERLSGVAVSATGSGSREAELEEKLRVAEATIVSLRAGAAAGGVTPGRKTISAGVASLMAKSGVAMESIEAGALDAALVSLPIEQRIAVKAQMMRAGLLG